RSQAKRFGRQQRGSLQAGNSRRLHFGVDCELTRNGKSTLPFCLNSLPLGLVEGMRQAIALALDPTLLVVASFSARLDVFRRGPGKGLGPLLEPAVSLVDQCRAQEELGVPCLFLPAMQVPCELGVPTHKLKIVSDEVLQARPRTQQGLVRKLNGRFAFDAFA